MKKKSLLAVFLLTTAGFFYSCNSDDSNPPSESPNLLEGTWKAETLSYDIPGVHSGTYPFDHQMMKQGCATDYLTIKPDGIAELKENNKNDQGDCEDEILSGTWTEQIITISEEETPRQISSVNNEELILIYSYTMMGHTTDVTVKYSRQ